MKKIISIVLAVMVCLGCCFALSACSNGDSETNGTTTGTVSESQATVAKEEFNALVNCYNGVIVIKGSEMEITADTTIQEVINFTEEISGTIVLEHLDTSRTFLSACQKNEGGYYEVKTDVDWKDYFSQST